MPQSSQLCSEQRRLCARELLANKEGRFAVTDKGQALLERLIGVIAIIQYGERLATLFNPLYPPILGDFLNLGDTPKPLAKGLCPLATPIY